MSAEAPRSIFQTIGDYELVEKLAEGGMGTVYKGRHRSTGQLVAVKIVPPHMAHNPVLQKRFENEFRAASSLDHPNIVRALEYGTDDGRPFLVMEFVEGESLGRRLARGRLPEAEAVRIIGQAAQGLQHAHEHGLIHRDVKPDNILMTPDGQVKLADLGLVKEVEADLNLTRTGRGLGTPHFMAPEQFRSAKDANVRCDVYSLAATLYMMVTGELPFRSLGPLDAWMKKVNEDLPGPREVVPELSERVDAAIRRAMSADPEQRPESALAFLAELTGSAAPKAQVSEREGQTKDIWYLVYHDEEGAPHTVKGTTKAIRRSLQEGRLGDASNVRACRTKSGPFEFLRSRPEFRDLVADARPLPARVRAAATGTQGVRLDPGMEAAASALPTSVSADSDQPSQRSGATAIPSAGAVAWWKLTLVGLIGVVVGMVLFYLLFWK